MLGLGAERMRENDSLFLYQLILPMCSVRKSGIRKDQQKYFYSEVENWINIYSYQLGLGGSYSRKFEHIRIDELVLWGGVFIHGVVRGESNGAMYRIFQQGSNYNLYIDKCTRCCLWLQI